MKIKFLLLFSLAVALSSCASVPTVPALPIPTFVLPIPTLAPAPTPLGPVSAPTETSAPSPTQAAPLPTTAASPTQPVSAAPTTASAAATACNNPFHPVSPTAQWKYQTTGSDDPSAVGNYTVTLTNVTANSFAEHRAFDKASVDTTWTCDAGSLSATQFGNLNVHGLTGFQLNTTQNTGITLPPADQWTVSKMWTNSYRIQGQMQQNGMTLSGSGTVDLQNTIAAQEQVTVPAGTFTAFRVDTAIILNLTPSGSIPIPIKLELNQSSWYAPNNGLVKSTLNMNSQTATTELVSYQP